MTFNKPLLSLTEGGCVNNGKETEINAHHKVGRREVTNEELGNVHLGLCEHADKEDATIA